MRFVISTLFLSSLLLFPNFAVSQNCSSNDREGMVCDGHRQAIAPPSGFSAEPGGSGALDNRVSPALSGGLGSPVPPVLSDIYGGGLSVPGPTITGGEHEMLGGLISSVAPVQNAMQNLPLELHGPFAEALTQKLLAGNPALSTSELANIGGAEMQSMVDQSIGDAGRAVGLSPEEIANLQDQSQSKSNDDGTDFAKYLSDGMVCDLNKDLRVDPEKTAETASHQIANRFGLETSAQKQDALSKELQSTVEKKTQEDYSKVSNEGATREGSNPMQEWGVASLAEDLSGFYFKTDALGGKAAILDQEAKNKGQLVFKGVNEAMAQALALNRLLQAEGSAVDPKELDHCFTAAMTALAYVVMKNGLATSLTEFLAPEIALITQGKYHEAANQYVLRKGPGSKLTNDVAVAIRSLGGPIVDGQTAIPEQKIPQDGVMSGHSKSPDAQILPPNSAGELFNKGLPVERGI